MSSKEYISGFTTNPTLMRKAGVLNYSMFAKQVLSKVTDKPVSFEVFTDDLNEMKKQGEKIASWGNNVYVKIPITNTLGKSTAPVLEHLSNLKIKVNVTAIMNVAQVKTAVSALNPNTPNYISIFAGRIAYTGIDPVPIIEESLESLNASSKMIWASPREIIEFISS
jgi:transaldolase